MSKRIQVSPSLNIFDTLSYRYTGDPGLLKPGLRVVVPVGNRLTAGWVMETDSRYTGRVKDITAVVQDDFTPDSRFMAFIQAVSTLYLTSAGTLLDGALPPKRKPISSLYFENPGSGKTEKLTGYTLKQLQPLCADSAIPCFYRNVPVINDAPLPSFQPASEDPAPRRFIIGYRRQDYYREIIAACIEQGRSVLITVPDNLTAAYVQDALEKAGLDANIDVYNSRLKARERDILWNEYALNGKTGVITGGLSAVLLPIANLGLIISDRAGSANYKRSLFSPYNVNALAHLRAQHLGAPLVEGFSTYTLHAYRDRSTVIIEDRRGSEETPMVNADVRPIPPGTRGIPEAFVELVNGYFLENKKILVVLNKKESVHFLLCGKCKKVQHCPSCDGFIDVDEDNRIKCRRCGLEKENHTQCHRCGQDLTLVESISVASVKKIIKNRVVETGITSISSEGLKEDHMHHVQQRIRASKIVIATPVVVNPYFSGIFDVIIYIRPESYFNLDRHDAAEKIFSMVSELKEMVKSGGEVDIFSTFHFHYALKSVNDESNFFDRELTYREWFRLPPFCSVYHIEVRGKGLRKLAKELRDIYRENRERLNIERVYLKTRKAYRGTYKGVIEAHAGPEAIIASGLLKKRDLTVELVLV
jgi:primosomal protein N'